MLIEASEEFFGLSEDDVLAALQDGAPDNPIAAEVSRLIAVYTDVFVRHCAQIDRVPDLSFRPVQPLPIEAVAMRLVADALRDGIIAQARRNAH